MKISSQIRRSATVASAGPEGIALFADGGCETCNRCSAGVNQQTRTEPIHLKVPANSGQGLALRAGDRVDLQFPGGTLVTLSSLVYLLPVLLMLSFAFVINRFVSTADSATALSALSGLLAGFLIAKKTMGNAEKERLVSPLAVLAKKRQAEDQSAISLKDS